MLLTLIIISLLQAKKYSDTKIQSPYQFILLPTPFIPVLSIITWEIIKYYVFIIGYEIYV